MSPLTNGGMSKSPPTVPSTPRPRRLINIMEKDRNAETTDMSPTSRKAYSEAPMNQGVSPQAKRLKTTSAYDRTPITVNDTLFTPERMRASSELDAEGELDPDFPLRKNNGRFARRDGSRGTFKLPQMPMMAMGSPLPQLPHQRHINNPFLHTNAYPHFDGRFYTRQNQPPQSWLLDPSLARRRSHGATATIDPFNFDPYSVSVNRGAATISSPTVALDRSPSTEYQPSTEPETTQQRESSSLSTLPAGKTDSSGALQRPLQGSAEPVLDHCPAHTPPTDSCFTKESSILKDLSISPTPERSGYEVPKKLRSVRIAMGEDNWNAYLEITERFLDGTMTLETLQSETNKIFQVADSRTAEKIRNGVGKMIEQWRRQNSPEY